MTEFAKVDLKEINSDVSRSSFSEQEIEQLADSILKNDSLLRPLIVKQTGIESFIVLDGHLEFYAAVRAREKILVRPKWLIRLSFLPKMNQQ